MDTIAIIAVFSPIMPIFVEINKKLFPKVNPRYFSIGFSLLVALGSGVLRFYTTKESFDSIVISVGAMTTFVFGIGTGLYQLQK